MKRTSEGLPLCSASARIIWGRAICLLMMAQCLVAARAYAYTDNFDRRNNHNLGLRWVESESSPPCDSTLAISSNQVVTSQCKGGFAYWNDVFGADQYSKLNYATSSSATRDRPLGGPAVRIQPSSSWNNASLYAAEYDRLSGVVRLWKYQNQPLSGPGTQLGTDVPTALAPGDWLQIRAEGITIEVLKNSTLLISVSDTTFSSGNAGIAVRAVAQSGSLGWINWEGSSGPLCNQGTNVHAPADYYTYIPPAKGSLLDASHSTYCAAIERLTDGVPPAGVPAPVFVQAEYATQNHFNAASTDADTRILVEAGPSSGMWVIDLNGNVLKAYTDLQASAEPMWDHANPSKFYFHTIGGNQIKRRDITTDATETIATFPEYVSVTGRGESDLSSDGTKMVLQGQTADGARDVFVYDLSTLTKSPTLQLDSSDQVDWLQVTNHFVVIGFVSFHGGGNQAARLYDINMSFQRQLANFIGHEDVGLDSNGDEILVISGSSAPSPSPCPGGGNCIIKYKLADGTFLALPAVDWSLAEHITVPSLPMTPSAWVYVSTYAPSDPDPNTPNWKPYTNEIVRFRLDGTAVERLAHHYSRPAGETYNWTPRSSINANGTRVLFNSNFGMQYKASPAPASTYTDVYMITVP